MFLKSKQKLHSVKAMQTFQKGQTGKKGLSYFSVRLQDPMKRIPKRV